MDVRDSFGATALHFAARYGNLDMIQWLVERKCNLRAEARNGATAAHDAAGAGKLTCLQCLHYHNESLSTVTLATNELLPLHLAAMFGQLTVVAWLVEKNVNPANARAADNNLPRKLAVFAPSVHRVAARV